MHADFTLLLLFAAATAVALIARRLRIPYTVRLVLAGLALGLHPDYGVRLTKELLYSVFLLGLLFEAAYHFTTSLLVATLTRWIRHVDDPMIEIALTTMTAYGSFLVAEHFHAAWRDTGPIGQAVSGTWR